MTLQKINKNSIYIGSHNDIIDKYAIDIGL
jgi:hypothetical protein